MCIQYLLYNRKSYIATGIFRNPASLDFFLRLCPRVAIHLGSVQVSTWTSRLSYLASLAAQLTLRGRTKLASVSQLADQSRKHLWLAYNSMGDRTRPALPQTTQRMPSLAQTHIRERMHSDHIFDCIRKEFLGVLRRGRRSITEAQHHWLQPAHLPLDPLFSVCC